MGLLLAGTQEQRAVAVIDENFFSPAICGGGGPAHLHGDWPGRHRLSHLLANGYQFIYAFAPWLAGAVLGAMWQVCVIFGLHWGWCR